MIKGVQITKKVTLYAVPALILALFIFIMNSDFLFKRPIEGYCIENHLSIIEKDIKNDNWNAASDEIATMSKYLDKKVMPYIQFSDERDNMNSLEKNLREIRAGISTKNQTAALISLENIKYDWEDLGR